MLFAVLALQKTTFTPYPYPWVGPLIGAWVALSCVAGYAGLAYVVRRRFGDVGLACLAIACCLLLLGSLATLYADMSAQSSRSVALVILVGFPAALVLSPAYTLSRLARRSVPPHAMKQIAWAVVSTIATVAAIVAVLALMIVVKLIQ